MSLIWMIFAFLPFTFAITEDIYNAVYREVPYKHDVRKDGAENFIPCVSMATSDKVSGCASNHGGNTGILELWTEGIEITQDTIFLMKADKFNDIIKTFKDNLFIQGIIVDDSTVNDSKITWSPDSSCPNSGKGIYGPEYASEYATCSTGPVWNDGGLNILTERFNFPILRVKNSTVIENLEACYKATKTSTNQKCSVELKSEQYIGKPTNLCLQRETILSTLGLANNVRCHPLGGTNMMSQLIQTDETVNNSSLPVIFLTTKIDAKGFFYELAPGGSGILSIVTFLSVIDAIGRAGLEAKNLKKQIVFALLDGEEFDYIGSSHMASLISKGKFPHAPNLSDKLRQPALIGTSDIDTVVHIGEIFTTDEPSSLFYAHFDDITEANQTIKTAEKQLVEKLSSRSAITIKRGKGPLPPGSNHAFKKLDKNSVKAITVNDFDEKLSSGNYGSRFDILSGDMKTISLKIESLSTAIAQLLVDEAKDGIIDRDINEIEADLQTVEDLVECLSSNFSCETFQKSLPMGSVMYSKSDEQIKNQLEGMSNRYVGVSVAGSSNSNYLLVKILSNIVTRAVGTKIGEPVPLDDYLNNKTIQNFCALPDALDSTTSNITWYNHVDKTVECYNAPIWLYAIMSPAFNPDEVSGKMEINENYSTWTESVWDIDSFSMKYFMVNMKNDAIWGWAGFAAGYVGLVVFLNSWVSKHSDVLFSQLI